MFEGMAERGLGNVHGVERLERRRGRQPPHCDGDVSEPSSHILSGNTENLRFPLHLF